MTGTTRFFRGIALSTVFAAGVAAAQHATMPATAGTALDGHVVQFPRDLSQQATVLILGFTKNSQGPTTTWERAVRTSLAGPSVAYFDIPFIEDAPGFVRPMILRSIRKQVPDIVKSHFVPLISGEAAWKQVAAFTTDAPDAAYVLLVDRSGEIIWQTHQPYSAPLFDQLAKAATRPDSAIR